MRLIEQLREKLACWLGGTPRQRPLHDAQIEAIIQHHDDVGRRASHTRDELVAAERELIQRRQRGH